MKKNLIKSILKVAALGIIILVIFLISKVGSCGGEKEQTPVIVEEEINNVEHEAEDAAEQTGSIFVYLCGAINKPGVYELSNGARIYEAINIAGGLRDDAEASVINMADYLEDAMQIYVPTVDEVMSQSMQIAYNGNNTGTASKGLININTADVVELQKLNGVGPKLAGAIVTYRDENGAFASKEEIKKVSGIGDGIFAKLENEITVK